MRGKGSAIAVFIDTVRITPAYAGKRDFGSPKISVFKDHPRVCGEKWWENIQKDVYQGSPPRMRGKD